MTTAYGPILARLYDQHWSDYAQKVAPLLHGFFQTLPAFSISPSVLDLGCGTGQLALHFLEAACPVTGLDLSEDMLFWARRNCHRFIADGQAEFFHADIRGFDLGKTYGLVAATYNTLNHLAPRDLPGCFQSTAKALAEGGIVLLDLDTGSGLKEWGDEETGEGPYGSIHVRRRFAAEDGIGRMAVEGIYGSEKFQETVVNHVHPVKHCLELLETSGLKKAYAALANDLGRPLRDPESEKRVFLVARK